MAGGGGDHARDAVGVTAEPRVVRDACLQVARLADVDDRAFMIEHAVDAGRGRQPFQVAGNDGGPAGGGAFRGHLGRKILCRHDICRRRLGLRLAGLLIGHRG